MNVCFHLENIIFEREVENMGVDTKGLLRGRVKHEEVLNFIRQKFDENAKSCVELKDYGSYTKHDWIRERYDNTGKWLTWSGFIYFNDGTEDWSIFYCYTNNNSYENLDYYNDYGLEDMVKSETTYLSMSCLGKSKEIMKTIVSHFGGWIDENDCDSEPYYPIIKNADGSIKPVIRITMEELYKKFGGVVLIKKDK
jgi:hypothetical protein